MIRCVIVYEGKMERSHVIQTEANSAGSQADSLLGEVIDTDRDATSVNHQDNTVRDMIDTGPEGDMDGGTEGEPVPTEQKGEAEDGGKSAVPIDRGWAWFILAGAAMQTFLSIGMLKTSGILFIAFQERFNSNSSMTSLLSTLHNSTYSVGALFVMSIGVKVASCRKLTFIGSLMVCGSFIISSLADDIRILLFSHGILQGLGFCLMHPTTLSIVGMYFHKRRGFANCIAITGGSLGSLLLAPLLTFLLQHYGYQGCMLLIAAMFLNGCVSAVLYRPQSFYTKRANKLNTENSNGESDAQALVRAENGFSTCRNGKIPAHNGHIRAENGFCAGENGKVDAENGALTHQFNKDQFDNTGLVIHLHKLKNEQNGINMFGSSDGFNGYPTVGQQVSSNRSLNVFNRPFGRTRTYTEVSRSSRKSNKSLTQRVLGASLSNLGNNLSSEYMCSSALDIPVITDNEFCDADTNKPSRDNPKNKRTCWTILKSVGRMFDFKLFTNPLFVTFEIASALNSGSCALSPVFVAPYARDIGIDASGIASLVVIYSALDIFSRLIVGVISDRNWIRRSSIVAISTGLLGISANCVRFYSSYNWLVFFVVTLGLFSGVHFAMFPVVIVDYLTLAKLQSALGFTALFHGSSVGIFFFVVGSMRDVFGTYIIPFHLLGCMLLGGSVIMLLLPVVEKRCNTRSKQGNTRETTVTVTLD